MSSHPASIAELHESACAGSRHALGRLLTIIERGGEQGDAIGETIGGRAAGGHVVGVTGAPGSGKSTLIGRLVRQLVESGHRPAVLAVDPSSPMTGGAILGDRIRMDPQLAGVHRAAFLRSMSSRGQRGGLAIAIPGSIRLFEEVGFDPIIVETVGVGQVEVDVAEIADTAVVVATPSLGDAIQANKSGLGEVADVFVVNKADLEGAEGVRRDLELMLQLGGISGLREDSEHEPPIVMCVGTTGMGVDALWTAVENHAARLDATRERAGRRAARVAYEVRSRVAGVVERRLDEVLSGTEAQVWLAKAATGEVSPIEAARRVLSMPRAPVGQ